MNIQRGKEMINQLKFYEIDELTIGTDTEQEEETYLPEEGEAAQISQGVDEEDEERSR
jgi:hypothetical protein